MRQKKCLLLIAPLLLLMLNGCLFYRSMHLAGAEPNVKKLKDLPYEVLGEVKKSISNYNLLWTVTVTSRPDFERALLEMASEKGGYDVIEVRWWRETQQWLVGTVTIIHIKGKVIRYIED